MLQVATLQSACLPAGLTQPETTCQQQALLQLALPQVMLPAHHRGSCQVCQGSTCRQMQWRCHAADSHGHHGVAAATGVRLRHRRSRLLLHSSWGRAGALTPTRDLVAGVVFSKSHDSPCNKHHGQSIHSRTTMCSMVYFRPTNSSAKVELAALGQAIGEALVISDMTAVVGHHRRSQLAAADQTPGAISHSHAQARCARPLVRSSKSCCPTGAAGRRINERSMGLASHCIATRSDDEASSDSDDGAVSDR